MIRIALSLCLTTCLAPQLIAAEPTGPDKTFAETVAPFLKKHCVQCHDEKKHSGDVRLDDLAADPGPGGARWQAIAAQIRDGLMPPPKEARPDTAEARRVVAWIAHRGGGRVAPLPNQGNLVPHEALFGKPAGVSDAAAAAARVWRLSPSGYMGFVAGLQVGRTPVGVVQPFTLVPERGIKDYAGLYSIDEPSTEILVRNAEAVVASQTQYEIKDGKVAGKNNSVKEFVALMNPQAAPTKPQLETAIQYQHRLAIGSIAAPDDLARYVALYEKSARDGDTPGAVRTMLQAVLLRTDGMYRSELGAGGGRRILAPHELALALSLALGDRREPGVTAAAEKGQLATKEQVAAHVQRLLDDPKFEKTRLLKFFREYFEYDQAANVFKERPKAFNHHPAQYVADTDLLILAILSADKDVFRELLTTDKSFVNFATAKNKQTGMLDPKPATVDPPSRDNKTGALTPRPGANYVYGFDAWPAPQPVAMPDNTRLGILMQPSWLVAWSTNFDNDVVRRGRWVRERLLGGTVPDLPIGVVAQVPDDPHRTYRDRLTVTRDANCWKCHKQMDELGLPFEQFDHYGRFRKTETVLDVEATAKNVDKKGATLGKVFREVELNTAGAIAESGATKLDGPVTDPREFVRRIAASDRARQVFIRHAFRFYMGRNENLSDAKTLQDADEAYLRNGGSFKAMLVSLLTSDAFLYRADPSKEK